MKPMKQLSEINLNRMIPSFITMAALCMGVSSIRYGLDEKWTIAVSLIIVAALLDGLDGRVARALNTESHFGAELDSLADIVSFGVAPAMVMYMWSLHGIPYKGIGWMGVLFYICCSAIRLAKFNSNLGSEVEQKKLQQYFTGLPVPSAAFLLILPLMLTFQIFDFEISHWFVFGYQCLMGILMISTIPVFSFKKVSIKKGMVVPSYAVFALLVGLLIFQPWVIIPIIGVCMILSIFVSCYMYYRSN